MRELVAAPVDVFRINAFDGSREEHQIGSEWSAKLAPYWAFCPRSCWIFRDRKFVSASVITSKPAICDHFKTGQRSRAQDM
jgi:hypothetical protein